ncbi:hypothetical protein vseg_021611 [Gypsophila vaccaria]
MASFTSFVVSSLLLLQLVHANLLCSSHSPSSSSNTTTSPKEGEKMRLYPLIDGKKARKMMMMNETRRKLGSFQVCAPCTCCGARGYCLPSPCCYAINCNIPNRPFGYCSFTPKTCNCFGCHL